MLAQMVSSRLVSCHGRYKSDAVFYHNFPVHSKKRYACQHMAAMPYLTHGRESATAVCWRKVVFSRSLPAEKKVEEEERVT